ncbi:uncharacterized protein LOC123934555 [Meles meles]|uniref:uncharacterized protein LOC123934555 n=1 Tax=Meles meles TaxID=9662 RepID=UPI001E69981D|nr:uncharacterized protein LOC123934555 [Meles meles]
MVFSTPRGNFGSFSAMHTDCSSSAVAPPHLQDRVLVAQSLAPAVAFTLLTQLACHVREPCDQSEARAGVTLLRAAPLITRPKFFCQPRGQRDLPRGQAEADRAAAMTALSRFPRLGRDPRFPGFSLGALSRCRGHGGALSPEQGGQERVLEPKIEAARALGVGWASRSQRHFCCQGWKRPLVSGPLARGGRLLMVPRHFHSVPPLPTPHARPQELEVAGLLLAPVWAGRAGVDGLHPFTAGGDEAGPATRFERPSAKGKRQVLVHELLRVPKRWEAAH